MASRIEGRIGDKYELSKVLGQGAMGTVYAAKNLRTGKRVAIKSLHVRGLLDPRDPEVLRFEQEARIAGSLESEHIAQVLDIDRDPENDTPYLVMELLRGEDLQSLLDRVGPLPVDVALRIAAQVSMGLAAAHAAGVVHRDIKPGNIFLARRTGGEVVVKILDFGIAKIRRLPPDVSTASPPLAAPQQSMTATGQLLGSPLYMSPEQVDGAKGLDARSDVFSLSVTLYAMLAGKAPHADVKLFPLLLGRIASKPTPKIREAAPWVGPEVEALLERATRLDREKRFQSAAAMLDAMKPLLTGGTALREEMLVGRGEEPRPVVKTDVESDPHARTESAIVEDPARVKPLVPPRRSRWRIALAVLVVVAALVTAWVLSGR